MKRVPRSKAIRYFCLECMNGATAEIRNCTSPECPLWMYRMGYETDENGERIKRRSAPKTPLQGAADE